MIPKAEQQRTDELLDNILKFWRHVFGGERDLLQIFTSKRGSAGTIDRATIKSNFFAYPKKAEAAAKWSLEKSEEGREVYFCAHLLTEKRRVKDNAAAVRSLWGELDGVEVPNGELKPTAVVESSPGHYHVYWRLTDAIPADTAEQLNKRLAHKIGADPSGFDLTQLLRVPGTTNYKYEERPVVEPLALDGGRDYPLGDLDRILPPIPEANGHSKASEEGPDEPTEEGPGTTPPMTDAEVVRRAESAKNGLGFAKVYRGGGDFKSDSERDMSLASQLAFWTQDEAQIERIMRGSGCVREKWDKHRTYLRDTIRKALSGLSETYTAPGEAAPYRIKAADDDRTSQAAEMPKRPARFERIDLGEPIESGIEPPEMLVEDELYAGRVHCIYSAGGTGKTFKALQLVKKVIDQDKPVLLLDLENGVRIISERLRDLGAEADQVRQHLYYYPFPSMPLSDDASSEFEELLEEIKPALVVIDSWINCISAAGLDENSSTDIARWSDAYPQRARVRGIASLLLDHVPKEGNTARGSGRKLDYVDAMWELRNPQKFDRETVGRIDMHLRKDREGWLPRALTFSVGVGEDGFIFQRSAGTFESADESTGLLPSDRTTMEALQAL